MKYYSKYVKYISLSVIGTSVGWFYYEVNRTYHVLNHAIDTSVLKIKGEPEQFTEDEFLEIKEQYPYCKKGIIRTTLDSLKFAYARRLVRLANSDNKLFRIKAVKHLANIKDLDRWHCALLANMIDPRTAVGLARTDNSDKRLIMEPPLRYHNYNRNMMVNAVRDFLIGLYERSNHSCMGYFLSQVFVYEHDNAHIVDNDSSSLELSKFIQSEDDILAKCLESLLHHSSLEKYVKDIVFLNGLPLLMEIHHRYKNNINISIKLCQIISYLSFDTSLLEPLHKSGWIGILSEWLNHEDVRISVPAARALSNLDVDSDSLYPRRLYLLHPLQRTPIENEVDVVFVHGLLGGVFYTWRQRETGPTRIAKNTKKDTNLKPTVELPNASQYLKDLREPKEETVKDFEMVWDDLPINTNVNAEGPYSKPGKQCCNRNLGMCRQTNCWPKDWLAEDCQKLRILGVNYETSLSMWAPICQSEKVKFTLEERSDDLLTKLIIAGVGKKPIVWITHSMGGLIVKNILCKAFASENSEIKDVCLNTKGIVFYSTPHNGSKLANLSHATALLLWPSVEVQELRENSPQLKLIHEKFLEIVKAVPMKIVTFVETKSTIVTAWKFNFLLVDPDSGNPGVGEYFEVPQDHLGICKPITKYSFLYQKVLHILKDILDENKED